MTGNLYLVATPIGNLEDITLRALNILKNVDLIATEDTRHSLKLLNHYEISKALISYHRHNEDSKANFLIEKLQNGKNIAIITDAGTPGISDPGEEIVKLCIQNHIPVIPIPGACAFINALICSGIDTSEFTFLGFLPLNKKNRKEQLDKIKTALHTTILYEAPHKLHTTLKDLEEILADRKIVIARELTKIHEEFISGTAKELIQKIENPKGEFVLIIEKSQKQKFLSDTLNQLSLEEHFVYYKEQGLKKNEIVKKIAKDRNVPKNEIYQKFI